MTPPKPILIIGAGPSSLSLAHSLHTTHLPFKIFERATSLTSHTQGYRFRLAPPALTALASLLPAPVLSRLRATCARIGNTAPAPFHHLDARTGVPTGEPRGGKEKENLQTSYRDGEAWNVDRGAMRRVLASDLSPFITFSKSFNSYKIDDLGVTAFFEDGSQVEGCLLVGADGVRSRVRRQLVPGWRLLDTEMRWVFGKTGIGEELRGRVNGRVGRELVLVQEGRGEGVLSLVVEPMRFQRGGEEVPGDYMYWVLGGARECFGRDDGELLKLGGEEVVAETRRLTREWDEGFRVLFEMQEVGSSSVLRTLSARPELPVWEGEGKVTLIGDAAHAMSPTAAAGATTALRSAAALARVIREEGISKESLRRYEDEMREFAAVSIKASFSTGKSLFGMKDIEDMAEVEE